MNGGAEITIHGNAANGSANAMAQGKIYIAGSIGAPGAVLTGGIICLLGSLAFARVLPLLRVSVRPTYLRLGILRPEENRLKLYMDFGDRLLEDRGSTAGLIERERCQRPALMNYCSSGMVMNFPSAVRAGLCEILVTRRLT